MSTIEGMNIESIDIVQNRKEMHYYVGYQWVGLCSPDNSYGRWCFVIVGNEVGKSHSIVDVIVPVEYNDRNDIENVRYANTASDAYSIYLKLTDKEFRKWGEFTDLDIHAFVVPKDKLAERVELALYDFVVMHSQSSCEEFYSVKSGFFKVTVD